MRIYKITQVLAVIGLLAFSQYSMAGNGNGSGKGGRDGGASTTVSLSVEESDTLVFMREEEKLARDVYRTLFDQWQKSVFRNISSSEQQHMDSLADRLDYYMITDPVVDDSTGAFVNTDLATYYLDLTTQGLASLEAAFYVGALIEELDILDLQHAIEESTHADLDSTYEELMKGSRNHLRAFVAQIENLGIVYKAQLMDQEDVDAILDDPMERG